MKACMICISTCSRAAILRCPSVGYFVPVSSLRGASFDRTIAARAIRSRSFGAPLMQLRTLRNGPYTGLAAVNILLLRNEIDPEQHRDAYSRQVELMRENARLDTLIPRVAKCDAATWLDIKDDAHQTSDAVARWWNRLKENADQGPRAENDGRSAFQNVHPRATTNTFLPHVGEVVPQPLCANRLYRVGRKHCHYKISGPSQGRRAGSERAW